MEFTDRYCHFFRRQITPDLAVSTCLPDGAANPHIIATIGVLVGIVLLARITELIITLGKQQLRTPDILMPLAASALLASGQYWLAFLVIIMSVISDKIELNINRSLYFYYPHQQQLSWLAKYLSIIAAIIGGILWWHQSTPALATIIWLLATPITSTSLLGGQIIRRLIISWQAHDVQFSDPRIIDEITRARQIIFDDPGTISSPQLSVSSVAIYGNLPESQVAAIFCTLGSNFPDEAKEALAIYERQHQIPADNLYSIRQVGNVNFFARRGDNRLIVGNYGFMLENKISNLPSNLSNLTSIFVAINGQLIGQINMDRKLRPHATKISIELHSQGVTSVVLITSESRRRAYQIGHSAQINQAYAQLSLRNKYQVVGKLAAKAPTIVVKNYSTAKQYLGGHVPHIWINHKNSIDSNRLAIYIPSGKLAIITQVRNSFIKAIKHAKYSAISVILLCIILESIAVAGWLPSTVAALVISQIVRLGLYFCPIR